VKDTPVLDEQSLVEDDRVKSIQRKVFLKTHRFELLPTIFVSVNDPYYSKWGGSLRGSFFLSDTLAVAVHASIYDLLPTDDVRTAKANFQSRIFYSVPKWSVLGAVEWSPIYGKATIFNTIIHFDGFILAGLGALWSDTSSTPLDSKNPSGPTRGPNIAGEFGLGLRFMTTDWLSVNIALINTSYVDQPAGTNKGAIQNILALHAGLSLFLPFRSTGRESE
jgi:outer membrane beta-barrel protein